MRKSICIIASVMVLSFVAAAQAPFLQVTSALSSQDDHKSGFAITITNPNNKTATAYVVVAQAIPRVPPLIEYAQFHWIDAVPLIAPPDPIPAGGSRAVATGGWADKLVSVGNVAVLYADGSFAGPGEYLDQFLLERRLMAQDIIEVLPILRNARDNPGTDLVALAAGFSAREKVDKAALDASQLPRALSHDNFDSICNSLAHNLGLIAKETPAKQKIQLQANIDRLTSYQQQLNLSRPPISN